MFILHHEGIDLWRLFSERLRHVPPLPLRVHFSAVDFEAAGGLSSAYFASDYIRIYRFGVHQSHIRNGLVARICRSHFFTEEARQGQGSVSLHYVPLFSSKQLTLTQIPCYGSIPFAFLKDLFLFF